MSKKKGISAKSVGEGVRVPGGYPLALPDPINEALERPISEYIYTLFAVATATLEPVKTWFGFRCKLEEVEAKQRAGRLLASIGESIKKWDTKLCETNAAYRSEKEKIKGEKQLSAVLFPGPIMGTVWRELEKAIDRRKTLRLLRIEHGAKLHKHIPEDYLAYLGTVDLPEPSLKREEEWWNVLWPLIKKNNPGLLLDLRTGKFSTRGIRLHARPAKFGPEFRSCLGTLLRLRDAGIL
jgi:hypothetical protein